MTLYSREKVIRVLRFLLGLGDQYTVFKRPTKKDLVVLIGRTAHKTLGQGRYDRDVNVLNAR